MGNAESQQGHSSRRPTPTETHDRKRRSLSPSQLATNRSDSLLQNRTPSALSNTQNSSASFHSTTESQHQAAKRRIQARRAKSFKFSNNRRLNGGSFRIQICEITGLSPNQKQLIQQKWFELNKAEILDMGTNVFTNVFRRERKFLRVIGLAHLADRNQNVWKSHKNFRLMIEKFCECLNVVIRQLDGDLEQSLSLLHELGAYHYCSLEKENHEHKPYKLPGTYWETLVSSISHAAKDLQIESSRGSESPSRPGLDKRFLLPGDDISMSMSISPSPSPSPTPFVLPSTPRRYGSVCPIVAESWSIFATFVVNHLKFGFQMEHMLKSELKRLVAGSVQFSWQSPSSDENTNFSSHDDGTLDGLSIQTNTTAIHGHAGGSISSTSNSSNSSSGSSAANVYPNDLPTVELIQHNGSLTMAALVE